MRESFLGINYEKMELKRMRELYPLKRASYSQFNTFMNCPYTFFLTYMQDNFERNGNKYTEVGSLLHDIFERQGKQLIAENPFPLSEAYKVYNRDFQRLDKELFDDKEDFVKMYKKGAGALENYYTMYEERLPLFLEKEFIETIDEGIPPIKSFIDRIDGEPDKPETWIITDYKTGSSPKSKDYLRKDLQLGLYASAFFTKYGVYPKAVQFFHPVPNKFQTAIHLGEGVYEFTGQRDPVVSFSVADTILRTRAVVAEIAQCVESGNWEKKIDSWSCKMCFKYETCKPFNKQQQGWSVI